MPCYSAEEFHRVSRPNALTHESGILVQALYGGAIQARPDAASVFESAGRRRRRTGQILQAPAGGV
jgi:hypothetical protein